MEILNAARKRIHEAPSISDVVKRNIKPTGKYIYFCPPAAEEGVNDMKTITAEAKKWFLEMGLQEEDIVFYQTTSEMKEEGRKNREAFYKDTDLEGKSKKEKLRIMFAINQYNEGVHAPNIDGVIMGRGTTSDIVYFEQLGRALSVRGETKQKFTDLEKYTIEQLIEICKRRDIKVKENTPKEEIIEKLLAPTIIDLTNNFDFIKELENNLKDRVKEIQAKGPGEKRIIKIRDVSFDIEIENQELYEMLKQLNERLTMTWDKYYEYAKKYYEKHGNLEVPFNFKTNNGYEKDDNGKINLGTWISTQRQRTTLESERGQLLLKIGMRFYKTKENTDIITDICNNNNIDLNINKSILTHISIQELQSKISFLQENNIPITDNQGKLHEIFSISNINMQAKYNISLEELISKYYIPTLGGRGV